MTDTKIMLTCPFCGQQFQHGPHRYGHYLHAYKLTCCDACWQGNHDGWQQRHEPMLLAQLERESLPVPPRRADNGLLPRGD